MRVRLCGARLTINAICQVQIVTTFIVNNMHTFHKPSPIALLRVCVCVCVCVCIIDALCVAQ
jgi:hypothetical protein